MRKEEPFYMRFVRRSQERKRERESAIKDNISTGLKESIGYEILLRMGWTIDAGLGRNKDGKTSLGGLLHKTKRIKQESIPEMDYDAAEKEYNSILKSKSVHAKD